MMFFPCEIAQRYSPPTNNRFRSSLNTRNQAVVQADRLNIQSINVRNGGRISRRSSNTQEESLRVVMFKKRLGMYKELYGLLRQEMLQMFYATIAMLKATMTGIVQSQEFKILKIKELSANICMMAKIQKANTDSDEGTSYDFAFISEDTELELLSGNAFKEAEKQLTLAKNLKQQDN
nr:hypothetical protein [Tanacetum cinerariifolium]